MPVDSNTHLIDTLPDFMESLPPLEVVAVSNEYVIQSLHQTLETGGSDAGTRPQTPTNNS